MHNDGYTLLEMLVVLFVSSVVSLLFIPSIWIYPLDNEQIEALYNYLHTQSIVNQQFTSLSDAHPIFSQSGLYFNEIGGINQAMSLSYQNKRYIIRLGFGNLRVE